jgi:AcrR family transcriptional regulator
MVSVATAYRYFSSAEDLWWEASEAAIGFEAISEKALQRVDDAGSDPQARLEALIRSLGFRMLDDQLPFRRAAKAALDQWFRHAAAGGGEGVPVRQGRRNDQIRTVLSPLDGTLPDRDVERITHALGLVIGAEAMISLTDAVGLEVASAKESLLDAGRWLLAGALAELANPKRHSSQYS